MGLRCMCALGGNLMFSLIISPPKAVVKGSVQTTQIYEQIVNVTLSQPKGKEISAYKGIYFLSLGDPGSSKKENMGHKAPIFPSLLLPCHSGE